MSFSRKDFTGLKLKDHDFSGVTEIVGSCFSQEVPDTEVFPPDLAVTFVRCNLDNVKIPVGCVVDDCTTKRFLVQNDLNDWIVNDKNEPVEIIYASICRKLGLQVPDVSEIPDTKYTQSIPWIDIKTRVKSGETVGVVAEYGALEKP